jgi:transcriptional regulator with XRE-family HTH domain
MGEEIIIPDVGSRIRYIRQNQGLSLRSLAEQSGLSANAISLIERGENSPTVSSLHRLASALDVPITDFFQDERIQQAIYVKRDQGLRFENDTVTIESLGIGLPYQQLEPFRMSLAPSATTFDDPITHPGEEFIHCLEGEIEYKVGTQSFHLSAGDSLLFDSLQPHCWKNLIQEPSILIMVFLTAQGDFSARQQHLSNPIA